MQDSATNTWSKQSGYIWSMIGSAVGFANILTFSAQCYKNGGGAFLIPFMAAMFILGLPMLYLEGLIGMQWKKALVSAYGQVAGYPVKIIAWLSVLACITIGGFYTVLCAYSLAYIFLTAFSMVPQNTEVFFQKDFLHLSESIGIWGGVSLLPFLASTLVLLMTAFVLYKGIQEGIEKICSIFLPLLAVIMFLMMLGLAMLPGAMHAWGHFLRPDFYKIMDVQLWRDVFGHLFFSFSLGLGIVVGYSRYNDQKIDLVQAMRWVAFGDFSISLIAGFAVFGGIGYMSHVSQIPFEEIVQSDSIFQIGFVVFPRLIQLFGPILAPIFGALFFFCVFVAGITGLFSIIESIVGNFVCEFSLSRRDSVSIALFMIGALCLLFCMGNGLHIVDAIAPMVMGMNMLIGGIAQILIFACFCPEIKEQKLWQRDWQTRCSFFLLSRVSPIILLIILFLNLFVDLQTMSLEVSIRWAWFFLATFLSTVLACKKDSLKAILALQ